MLPTEKTEISEDVSNDDALNNIHIEESYITSTRDNVAASIDTGPVSISKDKLHRRDPLTVRQEVQPFDDLIPETSLADVQLSEMPGLQNTEHWKRIAARTGQGSLPLSLDYYHKTAPILELQNSQMSEVLGSYRRPVRSDKKQDTAILASFRLKTRRRKTILGLSITAIIIAIIVAIVIAIVIVRRPRDVATDYYSGHIIVQAPFDSALLSSSSALAENYEKEFCSLVSTTLIDRKTKYAIFYSTCTVYNFRNGSIIGDFIIGFTRYQNVTRLNDFLDRTIINQQLFGGTILSIVFNSTTGVNANNTDPDADADYYSDVDYDINKSLNLKVPEQILVTSSIDEQQLGIIYAVTEKAQFTSEDSTIN